MDPVRNTVKYRMVVPVPGEQDEGALRQELDNICQGVAVLSPELAVDLEQALQLHHNVFPL